MKWFEPILMQFPLWYELTRACGGAFMSAALWSLQASLAHPASAALETTLALETGLLSQDRRRCSCRKAASGRHHDVIPRSVGTVLVLAGNLEPEAPYCCAVCV